MAELYFSTDIEADGPIPGPCSMLSFASAAFREDGELVGTFSRNLELLPDATPDPETMAWWRSRPDAWAAARKNPQAPVDAMHEYVAFVEDLGKQHGARPVFVAYPAGFDFTFVYWYLRRFAGKSPFSFQALDMKSFAMAVLGTEFRNTSKRTMPKAWFGKEPHTHVALDDAIEQGHLFMAMLRASREG